MKEGTPQMGESIKWVEGKPSNEQGEKKWQLKNMVATHPIV